MSEDVQVKIGLVVTANDKAFDSFQLCFDAEIEILNFL